jgi:hypothetical protein
MMLVNQRMGAMLEEQFGWVAGRDFLVSDPLPADRTVWPVADLGNWTPSYGAEDRAESVLDAPETPSLRFATASGLEILRAPVQPQHDDGPPPDDLYMIES